MSSVSMSPMMGHGHRHGQVRAEASAETSLGDGLVAKFDRNADGGVAADELQGTRLGRKMSVDTFAAIDGDGDGKLTAEEFDSAADLPGRRVGWTRHPHGFHPGGTHAVMNRLETSQSTGTEAADPVATDTAEAAAPVDGAEAFETAETPAITEDTVATGVVADAAPAEAPAEAAPSEAMKLAQTIEATSEADEASELLEEVAAEEVAAAETSEEAVAAELAEATADVAEESATADASVTTNAIALDAYTNTMELVASAA
ncbi:MAG: EF-hand domain-containing protein [Thalassovita sp.]|nr:EF-hand domain-containing protein [Thalassovita sp.]